MGLQGQEDACGEPWEGAPVSSEDGMEEEDWDDVTERAEHAGGPGHQDPPVNHPSAWSEEL